MAKGGVGIRKGAACNEECDVCGKSLKKGKHVLVETLGYIVRFCNSCADDVHRERENLAISIP